MRFLEVSVKKLYLPLALLLIVNWVAYITGIKGLGLPLPAFAATSVLGVFLLTWFIREGWRALLLLLFFRTFQGFQEIYSDKVRPRLTGLKKELEAAEEFMDAARKIERVTKSMSLERSLGRLQFKTSSQFENCERKLSKAHRKYDTAVGVALICGEWQTVQEVSRK